MGGVAQFSGFDKQTLPFLKAPGFHQNREWFHDNKGLYEAVVKNLIGDLVENLTEHFASREPIAIGARTRHKLFHERVEAPIS